MAQHRVDTAWDVGADVIVRCEENPLVRLDDLPFAAADIWNAGVVRYEGQVLLLLTVELLEGRSAIFRARSDDGIHFAVDPQPFMAPSDDAAERPCESVGIRDPRITPVNGGYYITYVADGDHGMRLGLARTDDFQSVQRLGFLSEVDVKNGMLFPRQVNGRYLLLSRPDQGASIWLGASDDLTFWGGETVVMAPRGGYWDSTRIGAAAPPIETDAGWLLLYYGERETSAGPLVRLGAALLDREQPARVLRRSNIPILSPRERYERIGDVPNVVFSCGALLDGETVHLYYGASDSCICLGTATVDAILQTCIESEKEY